jgi:tetratricopeptide (TPR) repeat protein
MDARNLGKLLREQGDMDGAKAAYEKAIASRDTNVAPIALAELAFLLEKEGDTDGAKAAYRRAIASGHTDAAPFAARNLGVLPGIRQSRSCGLKQRECPLRVAGVVAVGGGDVGVAVRAQEADGQAAQGCHDAGRVPGPDQGSVFLVGDVAQLLQGRSPAS